MRFESQWIVGCIDLLTSRPSTSTSKSSKTSFNEVAKRPSERQSHEVDLFYLNGFESYYKFTQEKWLTHAVSGVASNIILSGPTIAAFKPSTWFFIKDTRGATTMQTDDIHACLSAFSTPTAIPSNTNGAISKQSDLPDPVGERKNMSFPLTYDSTTFLWLSHNSLYPYFRRPKLKTSSTSSILSWRSITNMASPTASWVTSCSNSHSQLVSIGQLSWRHRLNFPPVDFAPNMYEKSFKKAYQPGKKILKDYGMHNSLVDPLCLPMKTKKSSKSSRQVLNTSQTSSLKLKATPTWKRQQNRNDLESSR